MAGLIKVSDRELTRLRVMIDLADDQLTVDAAATLMGLARHQIARRLRREVARNSSRLTVKGRTCSPASESTM
jgi:hypothetical protein